MDEDAEALREQVSQWMYHAEFEQIIELCETKLSDPNIDVAVTAWLSLSRVSFCTGNFAQARKESANALQLARTNPTATQSALASALCLIVFQSVNDLDTYTKAEVSTLAQEALESARSSDNRRLLVECEIATAYTQYVMSDYSTAWVTIEAAARHAHLLRDSEVEADALNTLATVCLSLGKRSEAIKYARRALSFYEQIGDALDQVISLSNLSYHVFIRRRAHRAFEQAKEYSERALALAREIGYRYGELAALNSLGNVYLIAHLNAEAIECFTGAVNLARECGNRRFERQALVGLSTAYYQNNAYTEALSATRDQLALMHEIDYPLWEMSGYYSIGNIYLRQKHFDHVLVYWQKALEIERTAGQHYKSRWLLVKLYMPYLKARSLLAGKSDPEIDMTSLLELDK